MADSTIARLKSIQNMTASEIRSFLNSDEFEEHGGKAIERNGRKVAGLMNSKGSAHTAEDTALIRQAIAAIEKCKNSYAGPSGSENMHEITAAKAYGYDHDKEKAEKPGDKPDATPAITIEAAPEDDDDDAAEDDEGDDEDEDDA